MMTAIESAYGNSQPGALGAVLGKNRQQQAADKAEAVRQGKSAAQSAGNGKDVDAQIRGVAEEFTSIFMNQIMKGMRNTVMQNPEMHGDNGEKFFQDLLDTEYSKSIASGSGYGLTDLVYEALASKARVSMGPDNTSTSAQTESEERVEATAGAGLE